MTGCKRYIPLQNKAEQLLCNSSSLEECSPLPFPQTGNRDEVDVVMVEWGTSYLVCQEKHKQLISCVEEFNNRETE